ncbi:MAG: bifunctional riboflavin kinase/FAD synthetase [Deltaproteobacteria bacterium]|nr:bifunctional riboflavin kinase/FAD synthetase [Deltaproteobacteria bacterium]
MKIFSGSSKLPSRFRGGVITLGVFDGVHRGHQKIFNTARQGARKSHSPSIVYTFYPHPVQVLAPELPLPLINTLEQRIELIDRCGLDAVIVEPFTKRFSRQSAKTFFEKILKNRLAPKRLIVGYDFTFGAKRQGTVETLEQLGKTSGIEVVVIPAIFETSQLLSSTEIRHAIQRGEVSRAANLLGHRFFIDGLVVKGRGIGKRLGIHTANLKTENELIPQIGVYSSFTTVGRKQLRSVTNIGPNATFGGSSISIETHILNFNRSLYGKKIRVEFIERIRDEMTFPGPEMLKKQILSDIQTAKNHFKRI